MIMMTSVLFLFGLGLLIVGAECLVKGASRLAAGVGISPLVVGLTVVAFGTSAPELVVSVHAAASGQADIALGNVVGSNICNVLLILGLAALISPLAVSQQLIRLDVPLLIGVSLLVFGLALDGNVGRLDGLLLLSGIIAYTVFAVIKSRRENRIVAAEYTAQFAAEVTSGNASDRYQTSKNVGLIILGLALLVVGARWLVDGALAGARWLGVSELIIGLTIVAVGTSLPEIATSVLASLRGQRDIAVGNVIGSNLFNLLGVLGMSSLISSNGVAVAPSALHFDLPVMLAVAVACLPIFFTGHRIERWEGGLFLAYYVFYLLYLGLAASGHVLLTSYTAALLWFVLPLTAITIVVSVWRARS
ncbi:MAG: calcium/sodium antiporter [Gammaproteobacteria bacterium]